MGGSLFTGHLWFQGLTFPVSKALSIGRANGTAFWRGPSDEEDAKARDPVRRPGTNGSGRTVHAQLLHKSKRAKL